jgi:hypothetical protein
MCVCSNSFADLGHALQFTEQSHHPALAIRKQLNFSSSTSRATRNISELPEFLGENPPLRALSLAA